MFAELRADRPGLLSAAFLAIVLIAAVFAPLLAPYGPVEGNPSTAGIPPVWDGGTWSHVLGTDTQGYDVLSRLMYGTRTTLLIGFAVVFLAGVFGVVLGLLAGYRGGRTDRWLMRWVDVQVAFPGLLIALIMIAVLGPSIVVADLRALVQRLDGVRPHDPRRRALGEGRPYVEAAEMVGCRPRRVMFIHILPNLTSSLVTLAVLEFARIILAEAILSFLGLGLQYPQVSLGVMANGGRDAFFSLPRLAIIPGVVDLADRLGRQLPRVLAPGRHRPAGAGEAHAAGATGGRAAAATTGVETA